MGDGVYRTNFEILKAGLAKFGWTVRFAAMSALLWIAWALLLAFPTFRADLLLYMGLTVVFHKTIDSLRHAIGYFLMYLIVVVVGFVIFSQFLIGFANDYGIAIYARLATAMTVATLMVLVIELARNRWQSRRD